MRLERNVADDLRQGDKGRYRTVFNVILEDGEQRSDAIGRLVRLKPEFKNGVFCRLSGFEGQNAPQLEVMVGYSQEFQARFNSFE